MTRLIHELIRDAAARTPEAEAVQTQGHAHTYGSLYDLTQRCASAFREAGLRRGERVAVYLDKRLETVVAFFAATYAGGVFVPVNPLYKPPQIAHILRDCNVRLLVTSPERLQAIDSIVTECPDLRTIVLVGTPPAAAVPTPIATLSWDTIVEHAAVGTPTSAIDADMAAILYTSGSTGKPKGVVLSHRNLVSGAESVAQYLANRASDRLLAVLPFSFDYGLSQLTTAFSTGASVSLINYLVPRDVILACERGRITGLAAVPPLWIQLSRLEWPPAAVDSLRYVTNSGGAMPTTVVQTLRTKLPKTSVYLMYGLTEAFRSTYLPPDEISSRPDSIGKAIPNAEILVVRPDGTPCAPNEPGELVHRGALVAMGYWNDPVRTAERFRPDPAQASGVTTTQWAVWSGDTVRMDEDGFLYFVGRQDDMIKTSGYRVSPGEIEEVIYASGVRGEAVALGIPHPVLGHAIVVVRTHTGDDDVNDEHVLAECKRQLPAFMVPARIERRDALPRNPNGKIDRKKLAQELFGLFQEN